MTTLFRITINIETVEGTTQEAKSETKQKVERMHCVHGHECRICADARKMEKNNAAN